MIRSNIIKPPSETNNNSSLLAPQQGVSGRDQAFLKAGDGAESTVLTVTRTGLGLNRPVPLTNLKMSPDPTSAATKMYVDHRHVELDKKIGELQQQLERHSISLAQALDKRHRASESQEGDGERNRHHCGMQGHHPANGHQGSSRGAQGARGETGKEGSCGGRGKRGFQGDIGVTGDSGDVGNDGPQGTIGFQGVQGDRGKRGRCGPFGPQGTQGGSSIGPQGSIGGSGPTGPQGLQGKRGCAGEDGERGKRGYQGPATPGPQGGVGAQGLQGQGGPQGSNTNYIAFATDQAITNGTFVGIGSASSAFLQSTAVIPRNGRLTSVVGSVRDPSILTQGAGMVGFQAYVNGVFTGIEGRFDSSNTICGHGTGSFSVNMCDLVSVRYTATGDTNTLNNGATAQLQLDF